MHNFHLTIKPPARSTDQHGSGAYMAPRGYRVHNGIDIQCPPESIICALRPGTVTKIGYPYDPAKDAKKAHYRYVQITDTMGNDLRYFYVEPGVALDDVIETGQAIGTSQALRRIYPGITEHIHFEVKRNGNYLDPTNFLTGMAR